jgi:hypothetical protein
MLLKPRRRISVAAAKASVAACALPGLPIACNVALAICQQDHDGCLAFFPQLICQQYGRINGMRQRRVPPPPGKPAKLLLARAKERVGGKISSAV